MVSVWLYRSGRPWIHVAVPMLVVMAMSGLSMVVNLGKYLQQDKWLLTAIGTAVLALMLWVALEGLAAIRRRA